MTTFSKIIGWIFGVLFALFSLAHFLSGSPVPASLLAVGAAVLLPPVREYVFQKSKYVLPGSARAVVALVLFAASAYFLSAQASQRTNQRLSAFRSNPDEVLAAVRAALSSQEWRKAIALAQDYLPAKNAELEQLSKTAKAEQTKLEQAAAEKIAEERRQAAAADQSKKELEARKKVLEAQFSAWDGSHRGLERYIKKHMNNPSSYEHVETKYLDKGDHLMLITKFRGTNAFGAIVTNTIAAKVDMAGNVLEISK
jgi:hypothetical protein